MSRDKYETLLADLRSMERVLVAFSGGVDSVFLLHAANQALPGKVFAVTLSAPYTPQAEVKEAIALARDMNVRHELVNVSFPEELRNNPAERCYLCKRELFLQLKSIAEAEGIDHILDGTNMDDLDDHRPGRKALLELGIRSPLQDAGLTKQEIRALSKEEALPTWNKPNGTCLLTRIPHDTAVDEPELRRIEEGELFLKSIGFSSVRLRSHGELARIEVTEEVIPDLVAPHVRRQIDAHLKRLGYRHVTLDMAGYRMGSLNEQTV
ncbi:ATP-dependent sacrificial sulfur transferase LarE [Halodesulfovibrio aestuarii]|uniref:ATP-dependent sacrificial sulfur transferase LarE n=1 Tax=Halodesulfovibrio aestuarii TaxID=126333 RepID=UPI003D3506EE